MPDLTNYILVFTRAGALLVAFPLFSATNIPVQLRIALAALCAFLIAPLLPPMNVDHLTLWGLVRLMFVEISVGLLLGFVCRLVFFALEFAGGIATNEMGLSLATVFNPSSGSAMGAPSMVLYWLAIMILLSCNLHHWMIAAFKNSYVWVPAGAAHLSQPLLYDIIQRTNQLFRIGVQIAAPLIAVSFVITIVFSTLSRAVPQMNVFSDSFSVRTLAGMAVFGLTCNLMAQNIQNYLQRIPSDLQRVAQLLGHG